MHSLAAPAEDKSTFSLLLCADFPRLGWMLHLPWIQIIPCESLCLHHYFGESELIASQQVKPREIFHIGNTIFTQINLLDISRYILATVYVHQRVPSNELAMFLTSANSWITLGLVGEMIVSMVQTGAFELSEINPNWNSTCANVSNWNTTITQLNKAICIILFTK